MLETPGTQTTDAICGDFKNGRSPFFYHKAHRLICALLLQISFQNFFRSEKIINLCNVADVLSDSVGSC